MSIIFISIFFIGMNTLRELCVCLLNGNWSHSIAEMQNIKVCYSNINLNFVDTLSYINTCTLLRCTFSKRWHHYWAQLMPPSHKIQFEILVRNLIEIYATITPELNIITILVIQTQSRCNQMCDAVWRDHCRQRRYSSHLECIVHNNWKSKYWQHQWSKTSSKCVTFSGQHSWNLKCRNFKFPFHAKTFNRFYNSHWIPAIILTMNTT